MQNRHQIFLQHKNDSLTFPPVNTQHIQADWLAQHNVSLDVLRLDKIHPVVSGNKWFKLKYYLQDAKEHRKTTIATFGGAWSNHIAATAFACREADLKSVGIIRGEKPQWLSATLQFAEGEGMELHFVSRTDYRNKAAIIDSFKQPDWYWVNEGGYGMFGVKGAAGILSFTDAAKYTHIIAAVGTGTMLAGLLRSSKEEQQVIGISSLKGNTALEQQVMQLVGEDALPSRCTIVHDYHFGGYGKVTKELIDFMDTVVKEHALPLDIVYTGKTFFAIKDLVQKEYFAPGSKLLMIHSGGLQGNSSVKP